MAFGLGRSPVIPSSPRGYRSNPCQPPKEGLPASNGFGVLGVIKIRPIPTPLKYFVNWFLSQEGQEWYAGYWRTAHAGLTSTQGG